MNSQGVGLRVIRSLTAWHLREWPGPCGLWRYSAWQHSFLQSASLPHSDPSSGEETPPQLSTGSQGWAPPCAIGLWFSAWLLQGPISLSWITGGHRVDDLGLHILGTPWCSPWRLQVEAASRRSLLGCSPDLLHAAMPVNALLQVHTHVEGRGFLLWLSWPRESTLNRVPVAS